MLADAQASFSAPRLEPHVRVIRSTRHNIRRKCPSVAMRCGRVASCNLVVVVGVGSEASGHPAVPSPTLPSWPHGGLEAPKDHAYPRGSREHATEVCRRGEGQTSRTEHETSDRTRDGTRALNGLRKYGLQRVEFPSARGKPLVDCMPPFEIHCGGPKTKLATDGGKYPENTA